MQEKNIIAMFIISVVAILQGAAWIVGFDGAVFAFTSLIIGGIAGSLFGFSISKKAAQ